MNDLQALVLLNMISSLGNTSIKNLLSFFKSPVKIFKAGRNELLKVEGITFRKAGAIKNAEQSIDLERELKLAKDNKIDIVTILDDEYPENLKNKVPPCYPG